MLHTKVRFIQGVLWEMQIFQVYAKIIQSNCAKSAVHTDENSLQNLDAFSRNSMRLKDENENYLTTKQKKVKLDCRKMYRRPSRLKIFILCMTMGELI